MSSKKQKVSGSFSEDVPMRDAEQDIVSLNPRDWLLQRGEVMLGSMLPSEHAIPLLSEDGKVSWKNVETSKALLTLMGELFTNPLDNCFRGNTQTYIKFQCRDGCTLSTTNDGSTLPIVLDDATGKYKPELAFCNMQTGSNFDKKENGGKKDAKFTAGMNGFGSKGCNIFGDFFKVKVANAAQQKTFELVCKNNMSVIGVPKVKDLEVKENETHIEWKPDFAKLGHPSTPSFFVDVCKTYAMYASLCAPSHVKVKYNGKEVKTTTPEKLCKALGGVAPFANETILEDGVEVFRICVASRNDEVEMPPCPGLTLGFVNSTPCSEGTLASFVLDKVGDIVVTKAKGKRGTNNDDIRCTPTFLKHHAIMVVTALIDNPKFSSQTKDKLETKVKDYGWKWSPSEEFVDKVGKTSLVEKAILAAREKSDMDAQKATKTTTARHPTVAKYDAASFLYKPGSTLIITEGDSAKSFAVSGTAALELKERKLYGIYPIRGKFLNVRDISMKVISDNKVAMELLKILGLQLGMKHDPDTIKKLPYQRLMVLSDQDVDGSHIAGLLFNLVDAVAPSLLAHKPDFLCRFATSLIRVSLPKTKKDIGFYSQGEYETWKEDRMANDLSIGTAKYFKGLGTSSGEQAKEYFRDLKTNTIVMRHSGKGCSESLDLFFNKKRSDDRKAFLLSDANHPDAHVPYQDEETFLKTFVTQELLPQFAMASLVRAIPHVNDGFKEAHRKVFFGFRDMPQKTELSVANAAGKIASRTNYHHRGTAMEETIIGMAANYAGTGNLNLLVPNGQFGIRHKHTAASAAYPKTCLNDPLHKLLFPPADDVVLTYVEDEGIEVEPESYSPVICTALCFGTHGIATGWSTDLPQYNPKDVLNCTLKFLEDDEMTPLVPYFRGFQGNVVVVPDDPLTFFVRGLVEVKGDCIHVHDVPPMRETEAYKEDWLEAGHTVSKGDNYTDIAVHWVVKPCKPLTDPLKELGLEKKISLNNMHLLGPHGKIKKYLSPHEILKDHAVTRLEVYKKRLAHQEEVCTWDLHVISNKVAYIQAWLDTKFDTRWYDGDAECIAAIQALNIQSDSKGSYDYLLDMPNKALNKERVEKLKAEEAKKREILERIKATTATQAWKDDLDALQAVL